MLDLRRLRRQHPGLCPEIAHYRIYDRAGMVIKAISGVAYSNLLDYRTREFMNIDIAVVVISPPTIKSP